MGGDRGKKQKKAKRQHEAHIGTEQAKADAPDAAMAADDSAGGDEAGPSGRKWTLSIALPGTLLDNPLSLEFAVFAAGQVARAAAAFQVDEVVVYDDSPAATAYPAGQPVTGATVSGGTAMLARILQFLDTPPHLRPSLHDVRTVPELRLAAALPTLSPPHHARPSNTWMPYREGVVLKSEAGAGSYVDVGMDRMVWLEHELPQSTRLTVHLGDAEPVTRFMAAYSETMIVGKVVSPSEPRERLGLYWGYTVRIALGLQRVFKDAAVSRAGSYDLTIGSSPSAAPTDPGSLVMPRFKHALVVFGGGGGSASAPAAGPSSTAGACAGGDLEELVRRVPDWEHKMPQDVFNLYINTTPHLGTLRLRADDAVPIALSYLISPILKYGKQ
ncbi:hypothetical protein TSOC_008303 [Tetrabaena socialis]|uniref:Uncharacterized protein n=1 Tax=Tetrabaena socialis TaxID=47790 RepID=A0A2J7ZYW6_9CHLO|nr:hypothetical protein TSOC_008303 [Tetrabaena socialis]|eukprot:PNH05465.1 hypothetical protein TSOC_008303 [Tetrabaena socialis]